MREQKQCVNWSKKVPLRYEADVAVIGGGIAGVSAALAAAEKNLKVIIVERFAVTGGNATSGGVAAFCGDITGQGRIFDKIISDLRRWNALEEYRGAQVFDYHILAIILQEQILKSNVKLLLHTRFVDVIMSKEGKIDSCVICGASGPEAISADVFIDCTGEASVTSAAGFETIKGRETDSIQLPMSMMGFIREVETEPQMPVGWYSPIEEAEDLPMNSLWPDGKGGKAMKVKIPKFDSTDTESMTEAEIAGRRRMLQVIDYYQRKEKKAWRYNGCASIIGIREGCRIKGDYILTVDDLRAGREFDDAIARGSFFLDAHKPDDDKLTYILSHEEMKVPPYQIPFRSIIPENSENLLVAGRCFSADQLALSSARVMTTGSMLGQAAGYAAALCVENKTQPRDLDYLDVRKQVEKASAILTLTDK